MRPRRSEWIQPAALEPFRLLDLMRRHPDVARSVTSMAKELNVPKSHVQHACNILRDSGFVERTHGGGWSLISQEADRQV
jgi:DNA-binding IclR family transcriptional regulator